MSIATELKTTIYEQVAAAFSSSENALVLPFIREKRKGALDDFLGRKFPDKKHEEYKYLALDKFLSKEFSVNTPSLKSTTQAVSPDFKGTLNLDIINGKFIETETKEKGIIVCSLKQAAEHYPEYLKKYFLKHTGAGTDPFFQLNNALTADGLFILVQKNAVVATTIHIRHIVTEEKFFINQRTLLIAEPNSECSLVESFCSANISPTFYNSVFELYAEENAKIEHVKIQQGNTNLFQVNNQESHQEKNSRINSFVFSVNGGLTRNNTTMRLNAEHIESHLYGVYLSDNDSVIDNHTLVDHRFPNCFSNELYKGIALGRSVAVFNGKIFVQKDAQKTNAFQSNKNILLSDDAVINTKPQLEIYADDVKCSHGTSTGKLDQNALFYLKARGIGEESDKKLLLQAFINEVCEPIQFLPVKDYVEQLLHANIR